jgi:hypothetical protein
LRAFELVAPAKKCKFAVRSSGSASSRRIAAHQAGDAKENGRLLVRFLRSPGPNRPVLIELAGDPLTNFELIVRQCIVFPVEAAVARHTLRNSGLQNALTQSLSLGEIRLNVALTQFKLSAIAKTGISAKKTRRQKTVSLATSSWLQEQWALSSGL